MERVEMERVHSGEETSVYHGTDGRKYLLRPVDREYRGRKKPPKYYLLVQDKGEAKPRYVSGLFATAEPGVLSGDYRDALGVKRMFTFRVRDAGAGAELLPGRAGTRANGSPKGKASGTPEHGTARGAYGERGTT